MTVCEFFMSLHVTRLPRGEKNFQVTPAVCLAAFITHHHPTFVSCFGINLGDPGCLRG